MVDSAAFTAVVRILSATRHSFFYDAVSRYGEGLLTLQVVLQQEEYFRTSSWIFTSLYPGAFRWDCRWVVAVNLGLLFLGIFIFGAVLRTSTHGRLRLHVFLNPNPIMKTSISRPSDTWSWSFWRDSAECSPGSYIIIRSRWEIWRGVRKWFFLAPIITSGKDWKERETRLGIPSSSNW